MPKPHTATGWWADIIDSRAAGRADVLAKLLAVSDRTLRRWRDGTDRPRRRKVSVLRKIAGKQLSSRFDAPEFLNAPLDSNN